MVNNIQNLKNILIEKINKKGAISFKDFMALSLYHQDFGYYSQPDLSIGKDGDFITAPHASKLFGYLLAVQIEECLYLTSKDNGQYYFCEFGAGTGILAKDILEYFSQFNKELLKKLTYFIIEPLEKRREILNKNLIKYSNCVKILDDFDNIKEFSGVIFANELLDAFPVHIIEKDKRNFYEIFITVNNGKFVEEKRKILDEQLKDYVFENLWNLPDQYRTEVNLELKSFVKKISANLLKGFVIFIDYGFSSTEYYAPFRNRGTLLGYSKHQITEDFLSYPGLIDITAHVNFSDLKRYLEQEGFVINGYCPQWSFLGSLDFEKTVNRLFGKIDPFSPELAQIKSLIFPQGMGESHKVFIASKSIDLKDKLKGFLMSNHLDRL